MRTDYEKKAPLGDFLIQLKREGLSGSDIATFREWLHQNANVWHAFEDIALKHRAEGKRGSAKWLLEECRSELKTEILNASTPILARMFNFKHGAYFVEKPIKGIKLTRRAA